MNFEEYNSNLITKFTNLLTTEIGLINDGIAEDEYKIPAINKYLIDYPDTVKNSNPIVFYILPNEFNFNPLTTNSQEQTIPLKVYLTVKGLKTEQRQKVIWKYAEALYNGIEKDLLSGLADYSYIENVTFYDDVEGTENCKAFEARIKIINEIE